MGAFRADLPKLRDVIAEEPIPYYKVGIHLTGRPGKEFNIRTAAGLLVLVGVIVNNGIVLVDYTNRFPSEGIKLFGM